LGLNWVCFWFIRLMHRWACVKKDMALHLMEKSER
jgi:hypothetical protein